MFIKAKERAGRTYFFLCISESGGNDGNRGKVIEYSVCLGETLNLSSAGWRGILRTSKGFRFVPLEDVLIVVEEFVKNHGLDAEVLDGLRGAVRGTESKSGKNYSSGRRSQTDEYTAALELLGLPPGSSDNEVELAFRKSARRHHPDIGGDPAKFRAIVAARKLLLGRVAHT